MAIRKKLNKAQNGISFKNTYAGPLTESDTKILDQRYPSTANVPIPFAANKPNMGYGTENQYRQIEKEDRSAYENYLRSPGSSRAYALRGNGLNNYGNLIGSSNRTAEINDINNMNNIDWNSEEGKHTKRIIDRDTEEARAFANINKNKKGGAVVKGSQLRRQASFKGLRTSRKHK